MFRNTQRIMALVELLKTTDKLVEAQRHLRLLRGLNLISSKAYNYELRRIFIKLEIVSLLIDLV